MLTPSRSIAVTMIGIGLLFTPTNFTYAADSRISSFFFGKSLGKGVGDFASSYRKQQTIRLEWDVNISKLKQALLECGNCNQRKLIEDELEYWQGTKNSFKEITTNVIDNVGKLKIFEDGNPRWTKAAKILLGLDDGLNWAEKSNIHERMVKEMRPDEYSLYLYQTLSYKECIPIKVSVRRCEMNLEDPNDPLYRTDCKLRSTAEYHCEKATHLAFKENIPTKEDDFKYYRKALNVIEERRQSGDIIPFISEDIYGVSVDYGTVPNDYKLVLPDVTRLNVRRVVVSMKVGTGELGTLSQIWMAPKNGKWMVDCVYGEYRRNYGVFSVDKICPLQL